MSRMLGRGRRPRVVAIVFLLLPLVLVPNANAGPDVRVSAGASSADAFVGGSLGLDLRGGVLRAAWADNSAALPGNPDRPSTDVAFAAVGGPNVNVTRLAGSEAGATLAVDPTNTNNLVVAANGSTEGFTPTTVRAFSRDGGATWSLVTGLPGNFGAFPPSVAFDAFGNCFLALVNDPSFGSPRLELYLSTDSGATFARVPLPDPAGMLQTEVSLAAGFGSVWLAFQSHDGLVGLRTLAAPVAGRGSVGAFSGQQVVPSGADARDPDVALGPGGAAIVAFEEDLFGATPSVSVAVDADGLGGAGFGAPRTVANVLGYPNLTSPQIAVGPGARTVLVFNDRPEAAGSEEIALMFSNDLGLTWSPAAVVNDAVAATNRRLPQVVVDPGSGEVGVAWFDFRSGGIEVWSDRFASLVRPPEPRAPVDLLAGSDSRTQIDLRWADTSDNETGFQVQRHDGNPFKAPVIIATLGPNATSYADTGLGEDTSFSYRVRAINAAGPSRWTNGAAATTLDSPPSAPTNLVASGITFQRIDLRWDPSDDPDGYEIQRSLDGSTWISLGRGGTGTDAMIFGLEAGREHFFRVRAFNSGGDSPFSNVASAVTAPSPPNGSPEGLTATAISRSAITLRWTDTSSNETRFQIERSTGGGAFKVVGDAPEQATSATDIHLKAATTYTYRVRACNPQGCSFASNQATATTPRR